MKRKVAKAIGITIIVLLCIYFGISGYMASALTNLEKVPVTETPSLYGLSYEDISFPSQMDYLTLKGWYIKSGEEQSAIIIVHGAEGNRSSPPSMGMLELASSLVTAGYDVLMFDLRGHGESAEAHLSGGYYEVRDLLGAVDYLRGRGIENIGVVGFSLGAAIAILAAAEEPSISAVVSDSSFADLTEIINREAKIRGGLPGWFTPGYLFMTRAMYGIDLDAVKPVDAVAKIAPRPILFIHGAADDLIPVAHVNRLYKASNNPSNVLWIVPGAGHMESYQIAPAEYVKKITIFLNKEL